MLVHLLLRFTLKNSSFSQCDSLEKNVSSFISGSQLERASGLGVGVRAASFSSSIAQVQTLGDPAHALTVDVSSCVFWSFVFNSCFLGVLHLFWFLQSFCLVF